MSRKVCQQCQRPKVSCLCAFVTLIDNKIEVVILQHPSEVQQAKATVPLLSKSLTQCQVIVDEDFSHNEQLNELISRYGQRCLLLYPSEHAIEMKHLTQDANFDLDNICLVILDGTWKKAYRMLMLSTNLHQLTAITLPANTKGQYRIRKTAKNNALSTLEACYHCLKFLENDDKKYQVLIDNFVKFNDFQLSFVPIEHHRK